MVSRLFELWATAPGQVQERVSWILDGLPRRRSDRLRAVRRPQGPSAPPAEVEDRWSYKSLLKDVGESRADAEVPHRHLLHAAPPQREPRPRNHGVVQPRRDPSRHRRGQLHRDRRQGNRPCAHGLPDGLEHRPWSASTRRTGTPAPRHSSVRHAAQPRLPEVVDAIASHDTFKYFVPRRIYKDLTGLDPSIATLAELAAVWGANGDMNALVAHIARRPEFFADTTIGNRVKSPVELLVSAAAGLRLPRRRPVLAQLGELDPPAESDRRTRRVRLGRRVAAPDAPRGVVEGCTTGCAGPTTAPIGGRRAAQHHRASSLCRSHQRHRRRPRARSSPDFTTCRPQTRQAVNDYASAGTWDYYERARPCQLVLDSPEFLVS